MKKRWKKVLSYILATGITVQSLTGYAQGMDIREKSAVKSGDQMLLQGTGYETAKEDKTSQQAEGNITLETEEVESGLKETVGTFPQESVAESEIQQSQSNENGNVQETSGEEETEFQETDSVAETESSTDNSEGDNASVETDGGETETQESKPSETEYEPEETVPTETNEPESQPEETEEAKGDGVYEDGRIRIYHLQQLEAIGSGKPVRENDSEETMFGDGEVIKDGETEITYSLNASYELMDDIALDSEELWMLPEGFSGTFLGGNVEEDAPLYEEETDTIYIYNNYQLKTAAGQEELKTVLSRDKYAAEFGMGQIVHEDAETGALLEYTKDHNYVLSKDFTEEMPELKARQIIEGDLAGREYVGQVVFQEGEKDYILIGNRQQLEAIGKTDKKGNPYKVTEPVWAQEQKFVGVTVGLGWWQDQGEPKWIYPGDADLAEGELLYDDPEADNPGVGKNTVDVGMYIGETRQHHMGSQKITQDGVTTYTYDKEAKKHVNMERRSGNESDLAYTTWADYIIFRDIDLQGQSWKPLMFSGTMEGRKNMVRGPKDQAQITIENIHVLQSGKMNTGNTMGIGFFGTITNPSNTDDIGISGGEALVKNLKLKQVTIDNQSTEVEETKTIVGGLMDIVGGLLGAVGGILDGILGGILDGILGGDTILGKLDLKDVLGSLLDARAAAPDTFAAGGFAGRIIGDVRIEGCDVEQVTVTNVMDMAGGFVGNVEGLTEYKGLGELLDGTVGALAGLLNIIPGLGLGDLVEILLDNPNLIKASQLIPTGYKKAVIEDCHVTQAILGNENTCFNGGFAGIQTGAEIRNSSVIGISSVSAKSYAGGFTGLTRDTELKGLLSSLNIDISFSPSSLISGCLVEGNELRVKTQEGYAGGMAGAVANSRMEQAEVNGLSSVQTSGNYAGGLAGRTTIGYVAALGSGDETDKGLLGEVGKLLSGATSGEVTQDILNLVGVNPSQLDGCKVSGQAFAVEAQEYAGGLYGQGDGTIMDGITESHITGLGRISAQKYAGGVAGRAVTANGVGVLNNTLGIGTMLPFSAKKIEVTGANGGYQVITSGGYAGGAFGQAIGGEVTSVHLNELASISAENYAGGFTGDAGTGSLVSGGGLDLLGLNLLQIDNLLSLAKGVVLDISECSVSGWAEGFSVRALGSNIEGEIRRFAAGGFIGEGNSVEVKNCQVTGLNSVQADREYGYAGGFAGRSETGGLASIAEDHTGILKLGSLSNLISAAGYLIPQYRGCSVEFVPYMDEMKQESTQVSGASAGGFIGEMKSGVVDNTETKEAAVRGILSVDGTYFAGGFAGLATSGGLAQSGGLSLLGGAVSLGGLSDLLSVLEVYVPLIQTADVQAGETGLTVRAEQEKTDRDMLMDANAGSAGGFLGYGSGVQIMASNVEGLRATSIPDVDAASGDGTAYFADDISYAVRAPQYAGGFAGKLDIGNAACVGNGLSVIGETLNLTELASALAVVGSKVERSSISGNTGGFSVLADGLRNGVRSGHAGGYAGDMAGASVSQSNVENFFSVIGGKSAGGYIGTLEPGDVANVLDDASVLGKLVEIDGGLLSLLQVFAASIQDSSTGAVPCGGMVWAEDGSAGGYAGHNLGGQITAIDGSEAAAYRIRGIYGKEYGGGYTGHMEAASVADTGSLKLLNGVVKLSNPLEIMKTVYAQETNTAVYGPLSHVSLEIWNDWVEHVGVNGPYGNDFKGQTFESQEALDAFLSGYVFGYTVDSPGRETEGGARSFGYGGGYAGKVTGGQITRGNAHDLRKVTAWNSTGGYAGAVTPASLVHVGEIDIAGLTVTNGLPVLETFVSVIRSSSVTGYQSGAVITATGTGEKAQAGYAGGYVGNLIGGQIWGGSWEDGDVCEAKHLRAVYGDRAAGGYAGQILPGSALRVDTASSNGVLEQLIGALLDAPNDLVQVLNATVATVRFAKNDAWDEWGIVIGGKTEEYAQIAGGFAGSISGAVIGESGGTDSGARANQIRRVDGGDYAGGFVGKADVSAAAEVSGAGETGILGPLLKLGSVDLLDIFRSYIYDSSVIGSADSGLEVVSHTGQALTDKTADGKAVYTGAAGGFAGALLCGSILNSKAEDVRSVTGVSYSGGFVGHMGKTGLVDADGVDILEKLLGLGVGVADAIGSTIEGCQVSGDAGGYSVESTTADNGMEGAHRQISGGFVGFADVGRMEDNEGKALRLVSSGEIAGGFVGKTSYAYLADVTVDGELLKAVSQVLDVLLDKLLHIGDLEAGQWVEIKISPLLDLKALWDGDALSLTVLGIPIRASLVSGENQLKVSIGDSEIFLNYVLDSSGSAPVSNPDAIEDALQIHLIKANRTRIVKSQVEGIEDGYDVYGGGASEDEDGSSSEGYAGGFVGYNKEGKLEFNSMFLCDVVRGTKEKVGPFSGTTQKKSNYPGNSDPVSIEGEGNTYRIYRGVSETYTEIRQGDAKKNDLVEPWLKDEGEQTRAGMVYTIAHMTEGGVKYFDELKGAILSSGDGQEDLLLEAYQNDGAKAVLMLDTETKPSDPSDTPNPPEQQDPCDEKVNLTVQKVWKDWLSSSSRPESVRITIYRLLDDNSKVGGEPFLCLELTKEDAESKNVWTKVIEGLDAYGINDAGEKVYYRYTAEEDMTGMDGYRSEVETSKDGYTITITNTKAGLLPDTGGMGTTWIYLGAFLLAVGGWILTTKKRGTSK